ncbi:MAG: bifunctional phosphoglucose/phosphomannose isomerase [Candidatus Brockarchaeota archaeon]|nr:bifunctional phosphoglucose/phosphomannose isomerase [Candidatus Brockarchaeota archaeon]MBO3768448.1 bifunctional phosphoglucose/phosphomannose isomerase [Candidatus Brockarchaeota archaeon]MBO3801538.1 bifunctional phosphoglucose/phosphomannose isomerase [Candidatus Brockarchaeota archaeon]
MTDWVKLLELLDKSNMYEKVCNFPNYLEDSIKISENANLKVDGNIKEVVACGMGGSAISLELTRSLVLDKILVPFTVVRDYFLPKHVNENSLVFISSYSGNTEETISCLREAISRGSNIVAVSSNGEVESICEKNNLPFIKIPKGLPPRAAFPYLFSSLFFTLIKNDLVIEKEKVLSEFYPTVNLLRNILNSIRLESLDEDNESKRLAKTLLKSVPVIYGYGAMSSVALRFKQQVNENAKSFAIFNSFPELNHNEFEGVRFLNLVDPVLILLRYSQEPERIKKRIEITKKILKRFYSEILELRGTGNTIFQEVFTLVFKLDMASVYLALLRGVDPSPTHNIDELKSELSFHT